MTRLLPLIFLAACTTAPDYSLISDDGPQDKLTIPSTRPAPRPERVLIVCPPKSPRAGKPVKAGHEDVLCYGEPSSEPSEPEKKEPETNCARNAWAIGQRVAPGYDVGCA